jgi:hypothetical protein
MRRVVPVLLGTLALAACGGDDRLSTDDYRAQARRICVEAKRTSAAIKQPTRATPAAIEDYFRRVLAANEGATRRFEDLQPPEGLQRAHDDTLKANGAGEAEVRRVVKELQGGGEPRTVLTRAQSRLQRIDRQTGAAAQRLGVPECAGR